MAVYTLQYTVHYTLHCNAYYTVYYTLHYMTYCVLYAIHYTLYTVIHCTLQTKPRAGPTLPGSLAVASRQLRAARTPGARSAALTHGAPFSKNLAQALSFLVKLLAGRRESKPFLGRHPHHQDRLVPGGGHWPVHPPCVLQCSVDTVQCTTTVQPPCGCSSVGATEYLLGKFQTNKWTSAALIPSHNYPRLGDIGCKQ
jgi:hypothetical protein